MTCDDWKAFVHDYVLGDLTPPAKALLDRHAEDCPSCLAEARMLQAVDRHLAGDPAIPAPAGLADRVMDRIPRRASFRGELVRLAAALLLVTGLGGAATLAAVQETSRRLIPADIQSAPGLLIDAARLIPETIPFELKE